MKLAKMKTQTEREWGKIVQRQLDKINAGKARRDRISAAEHVLKAASPEYQAKQAENTGRMLKRLKDAHDKAFKNPKRLH
jgi:hypothetical protein